MTQSEVYVYIAGKYSADSNLDVEQNILDAKRIAVALAARQVRFFCPHTHSAFFDNYVNASWDYYMDMYVTAMKKLCNCVIMVHNWENSRGAREEHEIATSLGFPVFYSVTDFLEFFEQLDT